MQNPKIPTNQPLNESFEEDFDDTFDEELWEEIIEPTKNNGEKKYTHYELRQEKQLELEERIASLPVFRENSLKLYYSVPIKDVHYNKKIEQEHPDWVAYRKRKLENKNANKRFQLVICKGEDVLTLACLQIGPVSICYPRIKGLPELRIKAETMCQEDFDYMNRYLEELLRSEKSGIAQYRATPIAMMAVKYGELVDAKEECSVEELQEVLEKDHLLEKQTKTRFGGRTKRKLFFPTKYGADFGLVKGYGVNERGEVYCRLFCSGEAFEELGKLLVWKKENKTLPKRRKMIPFKERIDRLNRDRPSDSTCGISVIQKFAALSIDEYLKEFPKELEELKSAIKETGKLQETMTYQEVAAAIYEMILSGKKESGKTLINILLKPAEKKYIEILEEIKNGNRSYLA